MCPPRPAEKASVPLKGMERWRSVYSLLRGWAQGSAGGWALLPRFQKGPSSPWGPTSHRGQPEPERRRRLTGFGNKRGQARWPRPHGGSSGELRREAGRQVAGQLGGEAPEWAAGQDPQKPTPRSPDQLGTLPGRRRSSQTRGTRSEAAGVSCACAP